MSPSKRSIYTWNTLGSVMNAAMSVLLFWVVTRFMGPFYGGLFSLAYAIGQQFFPLGAYEMRPYQATDVEKKFSFKTYLCSRLITVVLMAICIIIYISITGNADYPPVLLMLIAFLKLFDALEDVVHGELQYIGRLDLAGKAFFWRSFITTASFTVSTLLFDDLYAVCWISIVVTSICFIAINVPLALKYLEPFGKTDMKSIFALLAICFPLFLGSFFATYLPNAPKFGMALYYQADYQTFYNALFMPSLLINMLSSFVFRPVLTELAELWNQKNLQGFFRILKRNIVLIGTVFVLMELICLIGGIPILNMVFDLDLDAYKVELTVLIIGGLMNALSVIVYYVLVVLRKQTRILIGYAISAIVAFALSAPLIEPYGIMGASILYLIGISCACILFTIFAIVGYKRALGEDH